MGFPSACCEYVLLPLLNKEAVWGLWEERIEQKKQFQAEIEEKRWWSQGDTTFLTVSNIFMQKHRLIEIG